MNFKVSSCNKADYYLIANLEKSLFDSPFSIKDLERAMPLKQVNSPFILSVLFY